MRLRYLLPVLCALAACSGQPINQPTSRISQAQPQVSSQTLRSFSIAPVRTKGHRVDLEEQFSTATRRALEAKGYVEQNTGADMQVIYALGTTPRQGIELRPVMGANGAIYTQTEMTHDETAVLVMRILSARDQSVLFQAQISRQFTNPQFTQAGFDQGVATLLKDFPARKP